MLIARMDLLWGFHADICMVEILTSESSTAWCNSVIFFVSFLFI